MPETNETVNIAVMNQVPADNGPRAESPLHHVERPAGQTGSVHLAEQALLGHLVLRGKADALATAVQTVTGVELPQTPLSSAEKDAVTIRWVSPDEWLLTAPNNSVFDLENQLRAALTGHFAIVNVSGGQTILTLSGANAEDVLKKSTAYDIHPANMPVGKVVTSTFVKSQALIRRTGEDSFELVVRRSFADYIWRWIVDASIEYGLVVTR